MAIKELSVIIPARNEEFLGRTIEDVIANSEANTEVIAVLDGYLPDPPLKPDPRVTIIYNPVAVGQREASNQAAKIASGKYIMKLDAHCAMDKGFDRKMLDAFKETGDNVTMIPLMRNLHAFDWVCPQGHRRYQSPSGVCEECGLPTTKDVVWIAKTSPQNATFRFDKTLHFQYHGEHSKSAEYRYGVISGFYLSFDTREVPSSVINLFTNLANSHFLASCGDNLWFRQNVTMNTMTLSPIDDSGSIGIVKVDEVTNQSKMDRITTLSVLANMVKNQNVSASAFGNFTNQPSIENTMCELLVSSVGTPSISSFVNSSNPVPAPSSIINSDFTYELNNLIGGEFVYNEKTSSFHNGSIVLRPIVSKELNETLSIQGSCFMATKKKYFELGLCGEEFHSWGQQGVEVACKTWLSGGRVIGNRRTWYAHMFRTRGGDFGFPYANPQDKVNENREMSRDLFQHDQWKLANRKFQWLLDKFNPPDWTETKGIIYYTDNKLDENIAKPCRERIQHIAKDKNIGIVSSTLKKMDLGYKNVFFPSLKRGYLALFKQILGALENSRDDIIFFTEHDVLYHPSHFDFVPERKDVFYYNQNVWLLRMPDGHALHYDVNQLSGLCVYRETAIKHFRERYEMAEAARKEMNDSDFDKYVRHMGFEPMTHGRVAWKNKFEYSTWKSEYPNVDIKHGANATGQRWNKDQYRNQNLLVNWTESDTIPGWGKGVDLVKTLLP